MQYLLDLDGMAERLKAIQAQSQLNAKDFCLKTEIPAGTFSQIINGKTPINISTINKVIEHWGGAIDAHWFLFGESLPEQEVNTSEQPSSASSTNNMLSPELLGQLNELGRIGQELVKSRPVEIDHITVFYTDKSFATFRYSSEG